MAQKVEQKEKSNATLGETDVSKDNDKDGALNISQEYSSIFAKKPDISVNTSTD